MHRYVIPIIFTMLSAEHVPRLHLIRSISPVRKTKPIRMEAAKSGPDGVIHATLPDHFEHIFLVTGPAGCGKTTVAQFLAEQMNAPYVEGDDVSQTPRFKLMIG